MNNRVWPWIDDPAHPGDCLINTERLPSPPAGCDERIVRDTLAAMLANPMPSKGQSSAWVAPLLLPRIPKATALGSCGDCPESDPDVTNQTI